MIRHPTRVLAPVVLVAAGLLLGCASWWGAGRHEAVLPAAPPLPSPTTLTSDEPARQPAVSIEALLTGRIAGVAVNRAPGGGISVLVRGPSSFFLSNEPLYVVNGVPLEAGTMSWLNPHDIASIQVLKDAPSTAIYGVRGANGVVVIWTKGAR